MSKFKANSLDELKKIVPSETIKEQDKKEYQKKWKENKYEFRKMIAKKNRRWLTENSNIEQFASTIKRPQVYQLISNMFEEEKKRKWLIHIIANFMPLDLAKQVPKLPSGKKYCPFTQLPLTDTNSLLTGDRDKNIAYTGRNTDVVISAVALKELYRFVIDCTKNFDTKAGHIVNYALDEERFKTQ